MVKNRKNEKKLRSRDRDVTAGWQRRNESNPRFRVLSIFRLLNAKETKGVSKNSSHYDEHDSGIAETLLLKEKNTKILEFFKST